MLRGLCSILCRLGQSSHRHVVVVVVVVVVVLVVVVVVVCVPAVSELSSCILKIKRPPVRINRSVRLAIILFLR